MKAVAASMFMMMVMLVAAADPMPVMAQSGSTGPPPVQERMQTLTDQQKATIQSVLSRYSPASLTAEDAKSINEAFRVAGIRKGPGLRDAIKAAGFEPETIGKLAPPPGGPNDRVPSEQQRPERSGTPTKDEKGRQAN